MQLLSEWLPVIQGKFQAEMKKRLATHQKNLTQLQSMQNLFKHFLQIQYIPDYSSHDGFQKLALAAV